VLAGERAFAADAVIVGIGLIPGTAVGDCARHYHPALGRRIRLESVPSASEMAKVAASAIVGNPKAISALPWFWSDQFDVKLQMAGMTDGP
jgi:3-phenylpropionate/trans-cinnamate dioxygenase ferredoxin reductase subunit